MKLTSAQVERALNQFEAQALLQAQALPDDHPAVPQLNKLFGDHTFFLDSDGLHIVEPAEPIAGMQRPRAAAMAVKLASWSDEYQTTLAPHAPEPTDVVVVLGAANGGGDEETSGAQ